jgi:hypothetical protein
MKNTLRYILAIIILAGIVLIITITYMNYKIIPAEVYKLSSKNLIDDGGFENFKEQVGNCCPNPESNANIFASKSHNAFEGDFSLNLSSLNQCACITKSMLNFDNSKKYILSFYYKGDNPKICNLILGEGICNPNENFKHTENWTEYNTLLTFHNQSEGDIIHFYASSDGIQTVTNLYDDLQVHELISIKPSLNPDDYKQDQEYVIKTNPTNVISTICAKQYKNSEGNCPVEKLSDNGYYLVRGAPQVNLKFPWTELVLIIIMMLIVIRLLFRKQVIKVEETFEYELKKGLKKFR